MAEMTWDRVVDELRDHVRGRHFGPVRIGGVTIPYPDVEKIVLAYDVAGQVRRMRSAAFSGRTQARCRGEDPDAPVDLTV